MPSGAPLLITSTVAWAAGSAVGAGLAGAFAADEVRLLAEVPPLTEPADLVMPAPGGAENACCTICWIVRMSTVDTAPTPLGAVSAPVVGSVVSLIFDGVRLLTSPPNWTRFQFWGICTYFLALLSSEF